MNLSSASLTGTALLIFIATSTMTAFTHASESVRPIPSRFSDETKLVAVDGGREDYFGFSVAADGDTVLVGTPFDMTASNPDSGSVYVYTRTESGWMLQSKLLPSDGQSFDAFGYAIDVLDDVAVVSAPYKQNNRGEVYVFERVGGVWQESSIIRAQDGVDNDLFGSAVALSDAGIFVGAPSDDSGRGSVYVFTGSGDNWVQGAKLIAADRAQGDSFGVSLNVDGSTLVIGASLDDSAPNQNAGSVYEFLFLNGVWQQASKIVMNEMAPNAQFGASVVLGAGGLIAGSPGARSGGIDSAGAAHYFRKNSGVWQHVQAIVSESPFLGGAFGASLSANVDVVLVGAQGESVDGMSNRGVVHQYVVSGAGLVQDGVLLPSDGLSDDFFGCAVAMSDEYAVVGALTADVGGNYDQGAAYVFVNLATQTVIGAVSPSPSVVGQSYVVPVTVSSAEQTPGGSVQISDGAGASCTATLSNGAGSCSLTSTTVGEKTLTALYAGAAGLASSSDTAVHRVNANLQLAPSSLPPAQQGVAYSTSFSVSGSGYSLPVSYALVGGTLPQGIILSATGLLSGTPSVSGDYPITVRVTDSSSVAVGGPFSNQRSYVLVVEPVFTSTLTLQQDNTVIDRGSSQTFAAVLDVVEAGGPTPAGSFNVVATQAASSLNCSAAVSAEGAQSCSILFPLNQPAGDWQISASFVSDNADLGGSSDSASHRVQRPVDVAVSLSVDRPLYLAGQVLTYTLQVSNAGPDEAQDVEVETLLGIGTAGLSWTCSGSACANASGSGNLNELLDLPAGSAVSFTLQATVAAPAVDAIPFSVSATLSSAGIDRELDLANNAAAVTSQHRRLFGDGFED